MCCTCAGALGWMKLKKFISDDEPVVINQLWTSGDAAWITVLHHKVLVFEYIFGESKMESDSYFERQAASLTCCSLTAAQNWIKGEIVARKGEISESYQFFLLRNNCEILKEDSIHTWRQGWACAGVPPPRWQSESGNPARHKIEWSVKLKNRNRHRRNSSVILKP